MRPFLKRLLALRTLGFSLALLEYQLRSFTPLFRPGKLQCLIETQEKSYSYFYNIGEDESIYLAEI